MAYVEWLSETGWRQRSHDELTRHCGVICLEKQMLRGHELPGSKHKVYKRARVLLPEDAKSFNAGISAQGAQLALLDHTFLPIDPTQLDGCDTLWRTGEAAASSETHAP